MGNVQIVATTLSGGTSNQGFCYDEQNRVTWTNGQAGTGPCGVSLTTGTLAAAAYGPGSVTYDALDRMTSTASGTNVYGDPHHIHALTSMGPNYSASYDAAGNMTCRSTSSSNDCTTSAQNGQIMSYDSAGRLVVWQDAPSNPSSSEVMAYDGEGNRVALQVNGGTPTYYLGQLEEISGSTVTKYFSAGASGLPTAERVGTAGALTYLVSDGLGSFDMALDGSGNVLAQQLFFPYGRPFYSSGTMPTAKGFTGQRTDSATGGLVYLNARYYDYAGRQFLSADTANDGLNRYAYAHYNPETLSDPTGNTTACAPGTDLCNGKCMVCGDSGGGNTGGGGTCTSNCGGGGCTSNCGGGNPPGGNPPGGNPPGGNPPGGTPPTNPCGGGCQTSMGSGQSGTCDHTCKVYMAKQIALSAMKSFNDASNQDWQFWSGLALTFVGVVAAALNKLPFFLRIGLTASGLALAILQFDARIMAGVFLQELLMPDDWWDEGHLNAFRAYVLWNVDIASQIALLPAALAVVYHQAEVFIGALIGFSIGFQAWRYLVPPAMIAIDDEIDTLK